MVDLSVYCTVTCRQFPNLTFAPRKTCHSQAATSRFNAINVTAKIIIYNSPKKIKHFFARKLRAGDGEQLRAWIGELAHQDMSVIGLLAGDSPRAKKALLSERSTPPPRAKKALLSERSTPPPRAKKALLSERSTAAPRERRNPAYQKIFFIALPMAVSSHNLFARQSLPC